MIIEIKVPVLAESVPDATLLDWQKNIGEYVERGEILIDLETDKVTLEVASPEAGIVKEILKQSGDVVLTDDILAVIDTEGTSTTVNTSEVSDIQTIAENSDDENKRLGPAARKLIEENNIAISALTGTGNKGRITKADVLNNLETNKQAPEKDVTSVTPTVEVRPVSKDQSRIEERVPMTRLRKKTAERL